MDAESLKKRGSKGANQMFFEVGSDYLIRTVTNYWTGRVEEASDAGLVLSSAAWIADTGRFSDAVESGELSEVEPVCGKAYVSMGAVVDAVQWRHALPTERK